MTRKWFSLGLNLALILTLVAGCRGGITPPPSPTTEPGPPEPLIPTATPTTLPQPTSPPPAGQSPILFAAYPLEPVSVKPALQNEPPIDPQMGNVLVPLVLSPEQLQALAASGVVASPVEYPEFHVLYKEAVRNNLPVFITSDALLHAYHLIFDQLLSSLEENVFLADLRELNQALLEQAAAYAAQLKGSPWEEAARRLYAFLAVGSSLADPAFAIPPDVADLAQAELSLINAAAGPAQSPIFTHLKYGEDYSQYIPRGHYTKSDALKSYFKAMMWYGRMTFRLSDPEDAEAGPAETRMALLLTLALRDGKVNDQPALDVWKRLYDPTAFLVGRSDDLTIEDYLVVMNSIYGEGAGLSAIADETRLPDFITAASQLPAPRILGLISDDYKPMEAVKGLRLMGQRFIPDAYIFQELIHPKVPQRFLPSGLDVMAVMGSERAAEWLARQDDMTQTPQYRSQFNRLRGWMAGLSEEEWVETSYNAWLYALRPLLEPVGEGYPAFMQSSAWQDKQLNTALGSWAELKHDTLLYAKQPYGGLGGCGFPTPPEPLVAPAYVEPVPEVFARIAALAEMTRSGLVSRDLIQRLPRQNEFDPTIDDRLRSIASQALAFKAMAERQLQGLPLSEEDQATLRSFGNYLEELVQWVSGDQPQPDPAALIADVATDPNTGKVLEVGIGHVYEIYVVAPIPQEDGSLALTVARGGIFSYYEFASEQRLTNEKWRAMLKEGSAPAQPEFTSGFSVSQPASPDLQAAIYRFQRDWAGYHYWTIGYKGTVGCPKSPEFKLPVSAAVQAQARAAVAALQAQKQYEGRQWISTDYLSVEKSPVSPQNVIVKVRETWQDYLVTYAGDEPFGWWDAGQAEPITARRGPYTVDVEYELAPLKDACQDMPVGSGCLRWQIVAFRELTPRPAWQTP